MNSAASKGYVQIVQALIAAGANVDRANKSGWTPINSAANRGELSVVEQLIAAGADINQANESGWTPLYVAASKSNLPVVKALMTSGADINLACIDGLTPIHSAASKGHVTVVEALAAGGADINQASKNGSTPINSAAAKGFLPVVKALVAAAVDFNKANNAGSTPINTAANRGQMQVVKALIVAGADLNQANKKGWTPIYSAANKGYLPIVQTLIAAGADFHQTNDVRQYLLTGSDPTIPSTAAKKFASPLAIVLTMDGMTPLALAAWHGRDGAVMLLLSAGATVDCADNGGNTPLHNAASQGHESIARHLVAAGASVEISNALFEAVTTANVDWASELLSQGANPNVTNKAGETPLHVAVRCKKQNLLELLLHEKDVNLTARNKGGDTPLIVAIKQGHRSFARQIYAASTQPLREVATTVVAIDRSVVLGDGSFGVVYKGVFDDEPVAVKTLIGPSSADVLAYETRATQLCKSPYLLQLLAVAGKHTTNPQLVFEYMDGGDLRGYLDKKRDGLPVSVEYSALEVAWAVANALADLHHNGLLHRNLKSCNVLLSSSHYIKVADLAHAQPYASRTSVSTDTPYWTAPEVLASDGPDDGAVDIYSFGVILTELSTLKVPFEGLSLSSWVIVKRVRKGSLRPDAGDASAPWLRDLATACLEHVPEQRPTIETILTLLDNQRPPSLLSTDMQCSLCKASHAIVAATCPSCNAPTPTPTTKLKAILQSVAVAKTQGVDIEATLPCDICDAANDVAATSCEACGEEYRNPDKKLRQFVKAVTTGHLDRTKMLLNQGADPNAANEAGETPLHIAVRRNDQRLLELLLQVNGVDFTARNKVTKGETPLVAAIKQGHRRFAQKIYTASTQPLREVAATDVNVDRTILLGSGTFGVVFQGTFDNQPVAVKTLFGPSSSDIAAYEMEAMQLCKSPYLLQLLAVSGLRTNSPQLVLDYMDGGDLRGYLNMKRKGEPVPVEYSTLDVAWVIANALADLHHNGVLHRDLKSLNVLLSSINYIKVADLGLARAYASHMTQGAGTPYWTAPEVLADDGSYNYAADIYSFGVILTELTTLKAPFEDMTLQQWTILDRVRKGTLCPEVGDACAPWLRKLAADCMSYDPVQRPSAEMILLGLDRQRRLEASLVNTTMECSSCKNVHAMDAATCCACGKATPKASMKLASLLQRVAAAKVRGIEVKTTLPCGVCDSANDITVNVCVECGFDDLPSDSEKLRLLVKIVNRTMQAIVTG
ncbi:hypothetical protein ACHHYP_17402 [Achlya hypogyna]|uniref:Protein kinase domain-containing protein n=1 Tax=Achlya hypogyna TaxID=1202772 RepID=A0A1V9Y4I4_ACHHY|nr:hypothetical protein ACHHYP_17402 [Achlya hypogyna]